MTNDDFKLEVLKRKSNHFVAPAGVSIDLLHAAIGCATEAGEFLDAMKKCMFYGKTLDMTNVKEELGDMLWYITLAADALGCSVTELMIQNTRKLESRYGSVFTADAAQNRNLEAERKTLESTPHNHTIQPRKDNNIPSSIECPIYEQTR